MSSKSKDSGSAKDTHCTTFVPQAWRKHVCKNCFRTRERHEAKEPNGSVPGAEGKDASTAANKDTNLASTINRQDQTTKPTESDRQKSADPYRVRSPQAALPSEESGDGGSGTPTRKSDSLVSHRKAGLLSKFESSKVGANDSAVGAGVTGVRKGKGQRAPVGNNGKKKAGDPGEVPQNGKKSPSASTTLSPPAAKKSPFSFSIGKKSPLSPPTSKKSLPSVGKKWPLSPPTGKKNPLSPPLKKKSPLSPPSRKRIPAKALSPPVERKIPAKGKTMEYTKPTAEKVHDTKAGEDSEAAVDRAIDVKEEMRGRHGDDKKDVVDSSRESESKDDKICESTDTTEKGEAVEVSTSFTLFTPPCDVDPSATGPGLTQEGGSEESLDGPASAAVVQVAPGGASVPAGPSAIEEKVIPEPETTPSSLPSSSAVEAKADPSGEQGKEYTLPPVDPSTGISLETGVDPAQEGAKPRPNSPTVPEADVSGALANQSEGEGVDIHVRVCTSEDAEGEAAERAEPGQEEEDPRLTQGGAEERAETRPQIRTGEVSPEVDTSEVTDKLSLKPASPTFTESPEVYVDNVQGSLTQTSVKKEDGPVSAHGESDYADANNVLTSVEVGDGSAHEEQGTPSLPGETVPGPKTIDNESAKSENEPHCPTREDENVSGNLEAVDVGPTQLEEAPVLSTGEDIERSAGQGDVNVLTPESDKPPHELQSDNIVGTQEETIDQSPSDIAQCIEAGDQTPLQEERDSREVCEEVAPKEKETTIEDTIISESSGFQDIKESVIDSPETGYFRAESEKVEDGRPVPVTPRATEENAKSVSPEVNTGPHVEFYTGKGVSIATIPETCIDKEHTNAEPKGQEDEAVKTVAGVEPGVENINIDSSSGQLTEQVQVPNYSLLTGEQQEEAAGASVSQCSQVVTQETTSQDIKEVKAKDSQSEKGIPLEDRGAPVEQLSERVCQDSKGKVLDSVPSEQIGFAPSPQENTEGLQPDIVVILPSPFEDTQVAGSQQEEQVGASLPPGQVGLSPPPRSLSASPDDQWFETETELPPPPAFSDRPTSSPTGQPASKTEGDTQSQSPGGPAAGNTDSTDSEGKRGKKRSAEEGDDTGPLGGVREVGPPADTGARAVVRASPPDVTLPSEASDTGAGLLAIATPICPEGKEAGHSEASDPIPQAGNTVVYSTLPEAPLFTPLQVDVTDESEPIKAPPPVARDVREVATSGASALLGSVVGEPPARAGVQAESSCSSPSGPPSASPSSPPSTTAAGAAPSGVAQPGRSVRPDAGVPLTPSTHSPPLSEAGAGEPILVRASAPLPSKQEEREGGPEEEVVECRPVVASTFSPRVSSPSSNREVRVASATISIRQPSRSPSPSNSARSSPLPREEPAEPAEESQGQEQDQGKTCVSKVTSFVVRSPTPEQKSPSGLQPSSKDSLTFNTSPLEPSATLVYHNSKFDDDPLAEGYGSFASSPTPDFQEQEDITTIASVNVRNGKKVRQRPNQPSHQKQFQQAEASSSNFDKSIFHIARHKPQDVPSFLDSFDRTLQFGPSGRQRRRRMSDAFAREDAAMMEGTRMLIENLREKQHLLEEKCARLEREKSALSDLLGVKKSELYRAEERSKDKIGQLEVFCSRLEAENRRLLERLQLPEAERTHLRDQEVELDELRRKLCEAEEVISQLTEESASLQSEIKDMHLEMEEMHDQFRDDEALEFRDMQKELEATAKNCRILQFKLRKAERRNDAFQVERLQFEDKIKTLESRTQMNNEQNQIRELEEELRMAKEVSVRLHDELEVVEERRAKFEEELERVHDLFRDSEKGRSVLQKEVHSLTEEVEQLRERLSDSKETGGQLDVPQKTKPTLGKAGKEGSVEYDVEQIMRDLADSLEREHDLKGQLEHAEEETLNLRKKLSDLEDENEVIQIQLQKMSSAKSGKYFQKSLEDKEVITEREHELRIQLELAEEEVHVLRRKMDDMDAENEVMKREVRRMQLRLAGKDSREEQAAEDEQAPEDTRTYDERITAMAQDIDQLKWKLIEKDQESAHKDDVERNVKKVQEMELAMKGVRRPVKLSKSVSLDSGESTIDVRKQLETVTQEAAVLKEKMERMEKENDELTARNKQLEITRRGVPTVTADDAAVRNIELQDRIRTLEAENQQLRDNIQSLDDRTTAISKEISRVHRDSSSGGGGDQSAAETSEQIRRLEQEVAQFQQTINELQESNRRLAADLRQYEQTDEGKETLAQREEFDLEKATKLQLRERIKDMESDVGHLKTIVKNREEENDRLEREVNEYRDGMDKMLETFKLREADLQSEVETWEQKNAVLANLLDLVTERAESIKSEKPSDRSPSVVSAISDVTIGSDEVFGEKADEACDWDEKFLCRIRSLENLLKEERQKVQTVEKRLLLKDGQQSALTDDMKLHEREKEILQQEQKQKQILEQERAVIEEELTLCQKQLSEASEQSQSLREKLDKMHNVQSTLRQDFQRITKELETEKGTSEKYKNKISEKEDEIKKMAAKEEEKKSAGKLGGGVKEKEPASWRWEKQEMERTVKDLRKKVDDLHRQLSRQQVRVKMAGDDQKPRLSRQDSVEMETSKTKELENEIKSLKEDAEKKKTNISELEKDIKKLQSTLESREEQWGAERDVLEEDRQTVLKELTQKDDIIKAKENIIKQKDSLLHQRETALKERENSMLTHDAVMKEKDDALAKVQEQLGETIEQLAKIRDDLKQREDTLKEMEVKVRELNAAVSARDERIKEKDDILENLNRTLAEKDSSISDMDNTIRQAMKSMDEKEEELRQLRAETAELKPDLLNARNKSDDLERKLHSTEKEHGKEIAALVILREKMEARIAQLGGEKSLLEEETKDLRRSMMEKEDLWRSCRNELEAELRAAMQKVHALEAVRSGGEGDTLRRLSTEKEDLMNERNILVKEVKRLAREMENAEAEWQQERASLREKLRAQGSVKEELSRQSSLPEGDRTEESSHAEVVARADQASKDELLKSKLRLAQEELRQALEDVEAARRENVQTREVHMSSQKALSELKNKYDVAVSTWHDEKIMLERRACESEEKTRQLEALQRVVEQLESQMRQVDAERSGLDVRLKRAQSQWDSDRLLLQGQINKLEEQASMTSSGKFKWGDRQKREAAWDRERSDHQRALTECQNFTRDLEAKARTAERTRDKDYKDLVEKLESARKNYDREINDLRKRCTQMEEKSKQVAGLQKTLIDLQYKLQFERDTWLRERSELQRLLADSERAKLCDKRKYTGLLTEVKKVKELTPLLAKVEGVEVEVKKRSDVPLSPGGASSHRSSRVYDLPSGGDQQSGDLVRSIPIRRLVDEALQHISQLAEDLSKTDVRRSKKSSAPPAFRRSLSTSEVEEYREYVEYAQQQEEALSGVADLPIIMPSSETTEDQPVTTRPPASPIITAGPAAVSGPDMSGSHRSRSTVRRAFSQMPDIQITAAAPAGRASRPGSARSSMYASGTQSAYTSRDASPEKRGFGVRKITPYPVAPPSFLITPSRTPRRVTASMDREISMPEKHLQKLYDKLSAIEKEQAEEARVKDERLQREGSVEARAEAVENRRKSGMRMLVKSMSVDSYRDDPNWMPADAAKAPNAHFCPKQLDTAFDDAPRSETLPASVRIGELTITPGADKIGTFSGGDGGGGVVTGGRIEALHIRRQSQDARRNFYENYPLYSSGFFSWPRKSRRERHLEQQESGQTAARATDGTDTAATGSDGARPGADQSTGSQVSREEKKGDGKPDDAEVQEGVKTIVLPIGKQKKDKDKETEGGKKESKLSYFFSSVKERRKMFMKKSRSVDESPVRKSVMQAGLQAGRPAAPSTFETPELKESASRSSSLRQKFHKRAASLDVSSLFSVSSSGAAAASGGGMSGGHNRHSSIGTSGSSAMATSSAGTAGSDSKDQTRDGTCRVTNSEVSTSSPPLTSGSTQPKTPPNCRSATRWRTPSMEKASQRPIVFRDSDTGRFEIVVKRRSLSESNVVFLEHMQTSNVWDFSETRV